MDTANLWMCIWPRLSPDGRRVAVAETDAGTGNGDIWINELTDSHRSHLTLEESLETNPEWAANGNRIVFTSTRRGFRDIHWKDAIRLLWRDDDTPHARGRLAIRNESVTGPELTTT